MSHPPSAPEPSSTVELESIFDVPGSVVREALSEEELVILDTKSHRFYSLNSTGKRIYELAAQGLSAGQIVQGLVGEFEVPFDECVVDVRRALVDFVEKALLEQKSSLSGL